jgi:hypothetical protein
MIDSLFYNRSYRNYRSILWTESGVWTKGEYLRIWRETIVADFKVVSWHSLDILGRTTKYLVGTASNPVENVTWYLPTSNLDCYRYTSLFDSSSFENRESTLVTFTVGRNQKTTFYRYSHFMPLSCFQHSRLVDGRQNGLMHFTFLLMYSCPYVVSCFFRGRLPTWLNNVLFLSNIVGSITSLFLS